MLPAVQIDDDFTIESPPSKAWALDTERNLFSGFVDELEVVRQAVWFILHSKRYQHVIYDWNYGVELLDLVGESIPLVLAELERRIPEALLQDDRILEVTDFIFETERGKVHVTFTVITIFGDYRTEEIFDV